MPKNVEYIITLKDKFAKNAKGINKEMSTLNKRTTSLMGTFKKFAPLLAGLGVGLVFKKAIGVAIGFEKAMSDVKAITNANRQESLKLEQQAESLGKTTAFSAKEAAEGMKFLGMAGFSTKNIMSAIPGVLDLAAAGSIGLARAADIASNVLTQFGIKGENLGRVNDIIAKTATSTNVSVEQMAESLKYVGTTSRILDQSLESTSAAIGLLGNAGLQGGIGGTSLNFALLEMANQSSPAAKKLRKLGVQLQDNNGKFVGIANVIEQFEDKNISATKSLEIFGKRGGRAFGALLLAGSKQLKDLTADIEASEGAAKRMAEIKLDNLAGDITILKSATQGLAISFGKRLNPSMRKTTKAVTKLVTGLDKMLSVPLSETLKKDKFEFNALINVIEDGNTSVHARKRAIETLNSKYKPYLKSLITERTTQKELNELRKQGNIEFLKTIRLQARQELIKEEEAKANTAIKKIIELETRLGGLREKLKTASKDQRYSATGVAQLSEFAAATGAVDILKRRISELDKVALASANKVQKILSVGDIGNANGTLNLKTNLDSKSQKLETQITSRSPKVININIEKLIETQEINTKNLTESAPQIKRMITETILEALNDTQQTSKAS